MLACWLGMLVSVLAGQQPPSQLPPTFRAGVDAVQLDVSVLDKDRRPVRGLTAADFTVLEDGKPRQIVAFSAIELPAIPPAATPSGADNVPPDVVSNDGPQGRLVVILIDPFLERVMVRGRVTMADPPGITALRATANRIVDSLGPGDLAAVGHTIYGGPQNFTTDKTRLKRAIDSSAFGTNKRPEGLEWGNCNCGVCRLEAITRIADALRGEAQRRKTVFFIGERLRLSPVPGECDAYLQPATRRMMSATQVANVTVHTIDPNSLETTNVHAGDDFSPVGGDRAVSEAAKNQEQANRESLLRRQQSLQTVADWTGGRAILNTNAPEESVRSILEESSAYYLLAFQVSDVKPDGRFHPVTVQVNRPGVQVRTRKGYYADAVTRAPAAAAAAPIPLEAIATGLLPERGISMTVTAAPFRGPAGTPVIVVATGVTRGASPTDNAPPAGAPQFEPIEILTSAFGDAEKPAPSQRQRLSVAMSDGGQLKYESISTLSLKPGSYEVRVATRHQHANLVGSVHTFVDVPDFNAPLTLSGVVLFDRRAPTATPIEASGGILDSSPTTRRDFITTDEVAAFARVYQAAGAQPASVTVVCRILDRDLHEVTTTRIMMTPDQFTNAGGVDARFAIPTGTLSPGEYVLRIEAAAARATAVRDVRFSMK